MTVKDKNPGTSRKLCKIPISTPVKAARSTTKLFSSADQALKAIGIATDIKISSMMGERQVDCCIYFYLVNPLVKGFGGVSASKICRLAFFYQLKNKATVGQQTFLVVYYFSSKCHYSAALTNHLCRCMQPCPGLAAAHIGDIAAGS